MFMIPILIAGLVLLLTVSAVHAEAFEILEGSIFSTKHGLFTVDQVTKKWTAITAGNTTHGYAWACIYEKCYVYYGREVLPATNYGIPEQVSSGPAKQYVQPVKMKLSTLARSVAPQWEEQTVQLKITNTNTHTRTNAVVSLTVYDSYLNPIHTAVNKTLGGYVAFPICLDDRFPRGQYHYRLIANNGNSTSEYMDSFWIIVPVEGFRKGACW